MTKFIDALTKLLEKLVQILPAIVALVGLGYKFGARKLTKIQGKLTILGHEKKVLENEKEVNKDSRDKSDSDIVNDAISAGRDILRKGK